MSAKNNDPHRALWQYVTRGVRPLSGAARVEVADTKPRPEKKLARPSFGAAATPAYEASLDLHGLTLVEAHRTVDGFLTQASAAGVRRVLIVTGKGSGRPGSTIRGEIGHWLETPRLRSLVLSASPAPRHRGGDGALQVQLRKR